MEWIVSLKDGNWITIRKRFGMIQFWLNNNQCDTLELSKEAVEEIMKDSTIPKDVKAKAMMVLMEEECDLSS